MDDFSWSPKFYDERPPRVLAVQVTRDNYKSVADRLKCNRIEALEAWDKDAYQYVVTYKFLFGEDVRYTMHEGDYLIFTNPKDRTQVEVVDEHSFENKYQTPTIRLSAQEYEDFQKMWKSYLDQSVQALGTPKN